MTGPLSFGEAMERVDDALRRNIPLADALRYAAGVDAHGEPVPQQREPEPRLWCAWAAVGCTITAPVLVLGAAWVAAR